MLDYMRVTKPLDYKLDDILARGYLGIGCVEAGGPKPGVGCAGRGIISTFELLDQFKLKDNYDITIYDVLGDVVCGGFAVPIRREYADTILIVTSGEFMALYAANNILRGIRNYDGSEKRVAGIVYNQRNVEGEDERVERFAKAVDLPIFAKVPRSDAFTRAEHDNMTAMEQGTSPAICSIFTEMAATLQGDCPLYEAKPLTDEELEQTVLGTNIQSQRAANDEMGEATVISKAAVPEEVDVANPNRYLSKNMVRSEPRHGCAFNGAMSSAVHIKDAVILAHSPKSCAYITYQSVSSTGRRKLFERGALLPVALSPNIDCTEMGQPEIVFGGMEKLESKVRLIKQQRPKAIVIVSACPAGIIGDDIDRMKELSEPGMPIVPIKADGNMSGDFQQGLFLSYLSLARNLIRKDVDEVPGTVNIVAEKALVTNAQQNYELMSGFLDRMGVKVNCRFIYDTTTEALQNFCTAELNLPAYSDYTAKTLRRFFEDEYGSKFYDRGFPIGYDETCTWLREIGDYFGKPDVAEQIIDDNKQSYQQAVEELKPILSGKKLMVITFNSGLDWILKTALDIGMKIVKIGALDYSQDEGFRSRLGVDLPVELEYNPANRDSDLKKYKPDVLLANYSSSVSNGVPVSDTIPMCPDVGFESGLVLARRWARLIQMSAKGEWEQDEHLFEKYYA